MQIQAMKRKGEMKKVWTWIERVDKQDKEKVEE